MGSVCVARGNISINTSEDHSALRVILDIDHSHHDPRCKAKTNSASEHPLQDFSKI